MTDNNGYDKNLVSLLAHDLRTPINSVRGFIEVATLSGEMNDRQKQMLEKALSALDRMDGLINDVLDMSKVDGDAPSQLEPCDMGLVIREAVELLEGIAAQKNITIHVEIAEALPTIPAEVHRMKQAVNNLIGNAIKYNDNGGEVWVSAKVDEPVNKLVLCIRDTGYGIDEADLPHIFERFYRARLEREQRVYGNGLGLAIVEAIVLRHNGSIKVESQKGEGTTFTVHLPLAS